MSVTTYTLLRAQLKRWTRRNDIDDIFDTAIELVENEIYAGKHPLRVQELITSESQTCTIGVRKLAIPTSCLGIIKAEIDGKTLGFISVSDMPSTVLSGAPTRYTIDNVVRLDALPESASVVTFTYFKRPAKLTEALGTNTLLQNYPNMYFYGLQAAIFDYAGEPDIAQLKKAQFDAEIAGANHKFAESSFGPNLKMAGTDFAGGYRWPQITMRGR